MKYLIKLLKIFYYLYFIWCFGSISLSKNIFNHSLMKKLIHNKKVYLREVYFLVNMNYNNEHFLLTAKSSIHIWTPREMFSFQTENIHQYFSFLVLPIIVLKAFISLVVSHCFVSVRVFAAYFRRTNIAYRCFPFDAYVFIFLSDSIFLWNTERKSITQCYRTLVVVKEVNEILLIRLWRT